jgi:phage terminase small subunit
MALSQKQARFVEEYLVDLNGSAAAVRAGYSPHTARSLGNRLLTYVDVQAAIAEAVRRRSERTEVTQDRVLLELARIGFFDARHLFAESGDLLPPDAWPDDVAAMVAAVEVTTSQGQDGQQITLKKVRLWDKPRNLELLGKHLRMFVERQERTGADGGPIQLTGEWVIHGVEPGAPDPEVRRGQT